MWWFQKLAVAIGLGWLAPAPAVAVAASELMMEQQIRVENSVYCRSPFDFNHPFVQKEHLKESEKRIKGTGIFDSEKVVRVRDTKVIGADYGGHSWVWLEQGSNGTTLEVDIQFHGEIRAVDLDYDSRFSVPLEFEEGDWEKYQSGKSVKLKFTELGLKVFSREKSAVLRTLMDQTLEFRDYIQTAVDYYRFQSSGPAFGVFIGEQSECLEMKLPPSEFRVRVRTE